jgi:hypothetical protein
MRDVLSAARMILGVGLGTGDRTMVEREDELIGIPKARRGQAFDEAIRLVQRLWTEDHVTLEGTVFRCQDVTLGYRPVQQPHLPIVIACGGYVPTRLGVDPNDFYSDRTAGTFIRAVRAHGAPGRRLDYRHRHDRRVPRRARADPHARPRAPRPHARPGVPRHAPRLRQRGAERRRAPRARRS